MNDVERFFRNYERYWKETADTLAEVASGIDRALRAGDVCGLIRWKEYLEKGDGKKALRYSRELNRVLCLLSIIQAEAEDADWGGALFCDGAENYRDLYDRYVKAVFAIRRLLFRLSAESCGEGMAFLREIGISPYAVHVILAYDIQYRGTAEYRNLARLLSHVWTDGERRGFLSLAARQREA